MSEAVEKKESVAGIDVLKHEQLQRDILGLEYLVSGFVDSLYYSIPNDKQISAVNGLISSILFKISDDLDDLVTKN
ncbi:hypothetical protein [Campylobacter fetus]|uniref:hypothetical protein n=1 Tax=Campylobacter fetus TaxID=196 RepID=UPI0003C262D5|nr:hypothetical protein [Campylobacter fetus]AGZ82063.1 hypothetical protein CFT03427_1205 [Campylobacter fetus subsp. testudinum 03-427]ALV65230.1 hypothetical protein CFTSP3_1267 [Campylobacter fetus subsp. testudinum Sp3]EAI4321933.1 hypothetical protein [Campylobacter fetus]EAI4390973.1 hypothetical protein [Campylobacter fetus]EAK0826487.1 hypothetical protein [Campylobacter fetus]